jgi:uncharacterized cupredoxin-like copper-binding protein
MSFAKAQLCSTVSEPAFRPYLRRRMFKGALQLGLGLWTALRGKGRVIPGPAAHFSVLVAVTLLTAFQTHPAVAASSAAKITVIAGKPSEFRFKLSATSVRHGKVVFAVKNEGQLPHDFKICSSPKGGLANACSGKVTHLLSPGNSATLTYTFARMGKYEYLCTVPGHAAAGMKGDLRVT